MKIIKIVYGIPNSIRNIFIKMLSKTIDASYNVEGIITSNNCDFMKETDFIKAHKIDISYLPKVYY